MLSMTDFADSKKILYIFSVGCIESQNAYLDASGHVLDLGLHRNVVSNNPVPQQPRLTSWNPESQKICLNEIIMSIKTCKPYKS